MRAPKTSATKVWPPSCVLGCHGPWIRSFLPAMVRCHQNCHQEAGAETPGGASLLERNPLTARVSSEVPEVGLEPTLPEGNRILSPARLPIPPLRRGELRHYTNGNPQS